MWCDHGKLGCVKKANRINVHGNEAQSPWKKTGGAPNLQSSQKVSISHACEMKLGCALLFLENAFNFNSTRVHCQRHVYTETISGIFTNLTLTRIGGRRREKILR